MSRPRSMRRFALLGIIVLSAAMPVAGCDTGPLFRDNYWGKSILQPDQVIRPAERDRYGEPILEK